MNTKSPQNSTIRKKLQKQMTTYSIPSQLVKRELFGVGITNATTKEVLEYLVNCITNSHKNFYVVTPNPEILLFSHTHKDFQNTLNNADLALCDGMQLFRAARFIGIPLQERIIGTDFVERVCEKVADWPITVGFLGGRRGVAEQAAKCLSAKYPGLKIAYVSEEWNTDGFVYAENAKSNKNHELTNKNESIEHNSLFIQQKIDILFVAFGAPKQERWMEEHLNKIPVRIMIGVGGALDQIVDTSLRPPQWIHGLGMGWLYRLIREPWRIGRQIKLLEFVWLALAEKW